MANVENATLKLLAHQQEAYENVEELFDKGRYAAVIFPTGCGKSFVTLEYILQHPDQKILFLSPRNAIKEQMYEYVVREIGGIKDSVEEIQAQYGSMEDCAQSFIPGLKCMLYQTILRIGEKDSVDDVIERLAPDIIVVDEMHHLKTRRSNASKDTVIDDEDTSTSEEQQKEAQEQNEWGIKFQILLDMYPETKVLGLSATPVRNDGANVVERLFENSIAAEISLLEAMEEGIIIPPRYITPDFLGQDELETLLQQIENAEGDKKEALKERYDELVEQSSHAQGIPELLDENITERDGKYIIFCKSIQDMEEKQKLAGKWFGKIDTEPEIYRVSSKHKDSQQQLDDFNASSSEHIKLLYCVGMIDEGVHLDGVSGVILTAKTGSRLTYLQRLGRAISSGKNKTHALVIDLVNNNEILFDERQQSPEYGYEITDIESLQKLIDWIDEKNDGKLPENTEEKSSRERAMARRFARLNNKYFKYIENPELIESITDLQERQEIEDMIDLGESIGLWNEYIVVEQSEKINIDYLDNFISRVEIKGNRRDFREILSKASGKNDIPPKLRQARAIAEFYERKGRLPSSSSKDEEEKKIGKALNTIRQNIIKSYKELKTNQEKIEFLANYRGYTTEQIKEIIETIEKIDEEIAEKNVPVYLQNARAIAEFYYREGRLPRVRAKDEEEKKIGKALTKIRYSIIKPYKELKTNEEEREYIVNLRTLTEEQFMEIIETIEKIDEEIAEKKVPVYLQNARAIAEFYYREGRLPSRDAKDKEDKKLGRSLSTIRQNIIKPYRELKTNEEKIEFLANYRGYTTEQIKEIIETINKIDEEIAKKNIPAYLENARAIAEFYDRKGRLPRETDKEEKRLRYALHNIRQNVIKPYKEIKTEDEKKEYVANLKNLTEEQFMEIIETIEKIDAEIAEKRKQSKLQQARKIKEQATQKKSEAQALKKQTEQALDEKKGKTHDE